MIPRNELGVIVKFAEWAEGMGFELLSIDSAFPDAVVQHNDRKYRAEFEFCASNFITHRHDVRKCDLVICWENDWRDCILPVLALSESGWHETALDLPNDIEREVAYWKQRALSAERRLKLAGKNKQPAQQSRLKPGELDDKVRAVLLDEPDIGTRPLARKLDISPSTASGILKRVRGNGSAPQPEPAEAAVEAE